MASIVEVIIMRTVLAIILAAFLSACASVPPDGPTNFSIVQFNGKANKDERIPVKLHLPTTQLPSKPAVVLMGGCDGSVSDGARALIELLNGAGVVVAELRSIDVSGSACTRVSLLGVQRAEQAYRVRDALVERGLADEGNVGLLGFSHGGWAITHAMYADTTSMYSTEYKKPFAAAVAFYPHCQTLDVRKYDLKTPTLILSGVNDTWTPVEVCERMIDLTKAQSTGNVELSLVKYQNATHSFDNNKPARTVPTMKGESYLAYDRDATKDAISRTMEWFAKNLRM